MLDLVEISPYAHLAGADVNEIYNEVINQKQIVVRMFLDRYYDKTKEKINSLKTENAKINNYVKAYEQISPFFPQMDSDNVTYILQKLNQR